MSFWSGKRVAITGAGGTVGSHLAEQLNERGADLLLLDNSEIALWRLDYANGVKQFADVRDYERLLYVFGKFEPEVIFHAAALKHIPVCEANPEDAEKTNLSGTGNVCFAARWSRARLVVFVSTDKAVEPVSVMGESKSRAESFVTRYFGGGTRCVAVRFHNVFGSSGSVVDLFAKQIANGGPVTVTHPDMVRWFSAPQDACDLLLKCAEHALGPDRCKLYALEVGKPMRIMELARAMIGDRDIKIEVVGMRSGERLEEKLIADDERRIDIGIDGIFAIEQTETRRTRSGIERSAPSAAEERVSESKAARALH